MHNYAQVDWLRRSVEVLESRSNTDATAAADEGNSCGDETLVTASTATSNEDRQTRDKGNKGGKEGGDGGSGKRLSEEVDALCLSALTNCPSYTVAFEVSESA